MRIPRDPAAFFLSGGGGRPSRHFVWKWFDELRRATGLDQETLGRRARLHDVRHSYVLRTLVGWYRDGGDIEARLPLSQRCSGHVHPADTFWYFEGARELLALACERLERTWEEPATDEPIPNAQAPMPLSWERSRRRRSRQIRRVFSVDSGSVAVEVAIKMCVQYWRAQGRPERCKLMTARGGYHGDTFGAMAVCDPVCGMHALFDGTLAEHVFVDRPPAGFEAALEDRYAAQLSETVERHAHELAAVIIEPVVQGAGGHAFYSPAVVRHLRELCDRHDVLLILDEVATGFGRTGALFASHHAGVAADVMCVGKTLSGGYLPLAATLCTARIAQAISQGEGGALMHGPTYMGQRASLRGGAGQHQPAG